MTDDLDMPFPEPVEAIARQVEWVRDGLKPAVLVPHWQPPGVELSGLQTVAAPAGLFAFPPESLDLPAVLAAAAKGNFGCLLGYLTPRKPKEPHSCVTLLSEHGVELWSHLVDDSTQAAATILLSGLMRPGERVQSESPWTTAMRRVKYWESVLLEQDREMYFESETVGG